MPDTLPKDKKLVPISQAAHMLGVSIDTVRRWDRSGILHSSRPDGKNRYFLVEELKDIKFSRPLSISEAAQALKVSVSTLRRLEQRGFIKPDRDNNGERAYARQAIEKFLASDYFLRKKEVGGIILESLKETKKLEKRLEKGLEEKLTEEAAIKTLSVLTQETREEVKRLYQFRNIVELCVLSAIIFAFSLILGLTISLLIAPESTAKLLGYNYPGTQQVSSDTIAVLAARDVVQKKVSQSIFVAALKPFSQAAILLVKVINPQVYQKIQGANPPPPDLSQTISVNEDGSLVLQKPLILPDSEYLQVQDTSLVNNLNAESVQNKVPGEDAGNLVVLGENGIIPALRIESINLLEDSVTTSSITDKSVTLAKLAADVSFNGTPLNDSVTSAKIKDDTITVSDLSSTLTFGSGDLLDLSAITHSSTSKQGLILPNVSSATPSSPTSGEGYLAYDTSGDQVIYYNGSSWGTVGSGDITSVTAGDGLSGGGTSGAVTLSLNQGFAPTWTGAHTFEGNVIISDSGADTITIGNSLDTLSISSTAFALSSAGAVSGITTLSASGAITFSTFTSNGGVLYANSSGLLAQTGAGSSSQCLLGGTTPTWGSCAAGAGSNWEVLGSGVITPKLTSTLDFLLGAASTSSAKFGLININAGTPTATISANSGNNATYLTGLGVLGTTNKQTLTIGNANTGEIIIGTDATGRTITIGNATAGTAVNIDVGTGDFDIDAVGAGSDVLVDAAGAISLDATGAASNLTVTGSGLNLTVEVAGGGSQVLALNSAGTGANAIDLNATGTGGGMTFNTTDGTIAITAAGATNGDITISAADDLTIDGAAGSILNIGTSAVTQTITIGALTNTDLVLQDASWNITGAGVLTVASCVGCGGGGNNWWQLPGSGILSPGNLTVDLLVGGTTTASAKFAFINVNSGTPTASLSAGVAGGAFLTATGTLATTVRQTLTLGDTNTGNVVIDSGNGVVRIADLTTNGVVYTSNTNGTLNTEALLDETRGGTGLDTSVVLDGQLLIGNDSLNGFALAALTEGSGITITNAAGTITIAQTGGGASKWQQAAGGTLYPNISTLDLLVGGTSTSSARFAVLNINSGTPTATLSAGVAGGAFFNAQGAFQTTAKQSLTLGGGNTGDIVLSGFGAGAVQSDANGKLTSSVLTIANGGTNNALTLSAGGIVWTDANSFEVLSAGTANYCLTSGGALTPSWQSCALGPGTNFWNSASGTLYSGNTTLDLLIGGTATNSSTTNYAKFAVLNVNSGTPTASVSAGVAGGAYLTAAGLLQTTANQTLTLGGASTGNITLSPLNGAAGGILNLNTTNLQIAGTAGSTVGTASCVTTIDGIVTGSDTCPGGSGSNWTVANGAIRPNIATVLDLLIGGDSTSSANFRVTGGSTFAGTTSAASVSARTSFAGFVIDNTGAGNLLTASKSGATKFTILNNGNLSFAGSTNFLTTLASAATASWTITIPAASANDTFCLLTLNNCAAPGTTNYWEQNNTPGILYPGNTTVDLLVGGTATNSSTTNFARFAVLNVNSGTPTASVSAGVLGAAFLNATGSLQTTAKQPLTLGGGATGDIVLSGFTAGAVQSDANGKLTSGVLPIANGGTNKALTLSAGGIVWTDVDSFEVLTAGTTNYCLTSGGASTPSWQGCALGPGTNFWNSASGALYSGNSTLDLLVGGVSSAAANFRVTGASAFAGTTSAASISARTSFAGFVIDNTGAGDLFTASKSGATKFTILNNGNIQWAGETNFLTTFVTTTGNNVTLTIPDTGATDTFCLLALANCGGGSGSKWETANGAIYPGNTTLDLLTGGTSSASATFRATGNSPFAGTTSAASISARTSFAGFVIDNTGAGDLFTASKSGKTMFVVKNSGVVQVGNSTDGLTFDYLNGGPLYAGAARPTKKIVLNAEYAGAVLTASGSAAASGTMTSDASSSAALSNFRTYYEWSSSQTTLQDYTVVVRIQLPEDFSAWAATDALTVSYNTELATSDTSKIDVLIFNADVTLSVGDQITPVVYRQANASVTAKTWLNLSIDDSFLDSGAARDLDTAGDVAIVYLKMYSKDNNHVQVGDITMSYLAKF